MNYYTNNNAGFVDGLFGGLKNMLFGLPSDESVNVRKNPSAYTVSGSDRRCDAGRVRREGYACQKVTPSSNAIIYSRDVLDDFRKNVGRFHAETGGILGSTNKTKVDLCSFDEHSKNTSCVFEYNVEAMSKVFNGWKEKGMDMVGIYHSHPMGATQPSYHDISTSLVHLRFLNTDTFCLPIFQPARNGCYTMYAYVVRLNEKAGTVDVTLEYVLRAYSPGYFYIPFYEWKERYSIAELDRYRENYEGRFSGKESPAGTEKRKEEKAGVEIKAAVKKPTHEELFKKTAGMYPENVLDKVIVGVGVGGARSFYENMARQGFKNFILIDADEAAPSNVATQHVFISEMGKKKAEITAERIHDINPEAKVICVDRFLDDDMSDLEFKKLLDMFPGKKPTDYLIMGCTDNFQAQNRSALLALKYGCPYLAAGLYANGACAELIFTYPGVTDSCPRCLLRSRYEMYENGFENDVTSAGCDIFATEHMNAVKGRIALMLLMYHEAPGKAYDTLLDRVKDRNFVWIRLDPDLGSSELGITFFDNIFKDCERFTFLGETAWVPQHPDTDENGGACLMCGGKGDLRALQKKWMFTDTRSLPYAKLAKDVNKVFA